jgi:hypothetical protein
LRSFLNIPSKTGSFFFFLPFGAEKRMHLEKKAQATLAIVFVREELLSGTGWNSVAFLPQKGKGGEKKEKLIRNPNF